MINNKIILKFNIDQDQDQDQDKQSNMLIARTATKYMSGLKLMPVLACQLTLSGSIRRSQQPYHNTNATNMNYIISNNKHRQLSNRYRCYFSSTKLTKQQIDQSTEQELINKITKLYNYQQYKIPTALALLEVHHQYKIFKQGDWVLDIGAGPLWSWTDLALKLTHTPKGEHKVISNDLSECPSNKQNHVNVVGNFTNEPVRTKIAMHLLDRQLDVILVDATPEYSGNQQPDANYTLAVFVQALQFSERYLKKGGTIVLKILESSLSLQNQNQAKFFFNEVYRYKPSNFRVNSPTFFYVMKGFMMTQNLGAVQNFLKQYQKAKNSYSKIQIVQKYKSNYKWDPVMLLVNQAKQNILKLKQENKTNKDVMKIYEDDPFVKAGQIIQLIDTLQDTKANKIEKIKAEKKLLTGSDQFQIPLPKNQEQFAQIIFKEAQRLQQQEKRQQEQRENKKRAKQAHRRGKSKIKPADKKNVQQKAPLGQNQVYMKSIKVATQQKQLTEPSLLQKLNYRQYLQEDLYGYNPSDPYAPINKTVKKTQKQQLEQQQIDLMKLVQSFPQVKEALAKNKGSFEQAYKNTSQEIKDHFKRIFDEEQDQQSDVKEKKKKKQYGFEDQLNSKKSDDDFLQDQDDPLSEPDNKTKTYNINKAKHKNLRKTEISSQFDFDSDVIRNEKEEQEKIFEQMRKQQQAIELNKSQYLTSKPKKSQRPLNYKKNRKEGGKDQNYFKHKKKHTDL